MGKQSKKKRQQRQKQQRKDDEVVGAALEAQVARLRRLQLSREACGTEGQEHPNDDLARAEACGFRVCDARAEAQREERGAQVDAAGAAAAAADELRQDLDTRPSSGPSDSDGGDGGDASGSPVGRCTDDYFLAMHAPLERAERKRQDDAALHRDNGSKRRGQPAARPDSAHRAGSSSGFGALEVDSGDSSDESSDSQRGVATMDDASTDSGEHEDDEPLETVVDRDGQQIHVEGELIDAILAIRTQASYLAPKKVAAKLKQQGFETAELRRVIDAVWAMDI
jgi:hypothetical protein